MFKQRINDEINRLVHVVMADQQTDGSWHYPFETGISTDAYMIILLRTLEINDEDFIMYLTKRIFHKQEKNGSWKLFHDEKDGNISLTVEAYYALLYSGYYHKSDYRLQTAKQYILNNGGLSKVQMFTKILLAITGQIRWPHHFPLRIEMIILPQTFPVNFFDISVFGRANLIPILILADKKYSLRTPRAPSLADLMVDRNDDWHLEWNFLNDKRDPFSFLEKSIESLLNLPENIHHESIKQAEQYMLNRIEPDGTLYNYFSSTFYMIFALLSLGYRKNDAIINSAIKGLKSMGTNIDDLPHIQYTTATVWNTSLINYALQESGVSHHHPTVVRANQYLLKRQHTKYGDWSIHNPNTLPGGWGFSDQNTINPDIDDTTASLRSLCRLVKEGSLYEQIWNKAIRWLMSMQNEDGGWPSFEKDVNKPYVQLLPVENNEFLLIDPSSADLTGRTLEFFGNYTNLTKNHPSIVDGVNWLISTQKEDGSWYGRWGICYIYGTWAAITGMVAAGVPVHHSSIQKGVSWLKSIQNRDGGWGESCLSDIHKTYVPLGKSTLTQTAWAIDALIAASTTPTIDIQSGVEFLLNSKNLDWSTTYPVGQGMAGGFYMFYHSYNVIFPLLALSHYKNKFY